MAVAQTRTILIRRMMKFFAKQRHDQQQRENDQFRGHSDHHLKQLRETWKRSPELPAG